jgi:hypothetical protein
MHAEHKAGDKMYVDFTGRKLHPSHPYNGSAIPVEVFVAILGCGQLTYVEAVSGQKKKILSGSAKTPCVTLAAYPQPLSRVMGNVAAPESAVF